MRIVKREVCRPLSTITLWLISTFTYIFEKFNGMINPNKEWVWWMVIPVMFLIWTSINWKIKK
jgi:hypothetical protein